MTEWVKEDLLKALRDRLDESNAIWDKPQQENETFALHYKSRELIQSCIDDLCDQYPESEHSLALQCHFLVRVAVLSADVEEPQECQIALEKSLANLEKCSQIPWIIGPKIMTFNQYGILWSGRGEMEKAKMYLHKARTFYDENKSRPELFSLNDLLSPLDCNPKDEDRKNAVGLANCYTYYYLAQVYETCGEPDRAGEYCHITVCRQLELKEYIPKEWTINVATLSFHYTMNNRFSVAHAHLFAARMVIDDALQRAEKELEGQDALEDMKLASAQLDRAWAKYCLVLLQTSESILLNEENHLLDHKQQADDSQLEEDIFKALKAIFPDLDLAAAVKEQEQFPKSFATNFDEARAIFLPGQRACRKAREHYTFEDHCTDYVLLNLDQSKMNKLLVSFEEDWERKYKIHKRRIELLEKPLKELNQKFYLDICRQLMYDLGDLYESLMDIKLEQLQDQELTKDQLPVEEKRKINRNIALSIRYYSEFVQSFEQNDPYPAGSCSTVLYAHFHLARLYEKFLTKENTTDQLRNLYKSQHHFNSIKTYCEKHPQAGESLGPTLPIAREMCELLPLKIQKVSLHARMQKD